MSVLQQARLLGVGVVRYGDGLLDRVREAAPRGSLRPSNAIGTDEAADVSLALVPDRQRIVTIAGHVRARQDGFVVLAGPRPAAPDFRNTVRPRLIALAAAGDLVVPVAWTFPFDQAREALELLQTGHAGGKLALLP